MSCCSDVMKPIEASSCCTAQDTVARAARAIRDSGGGCAPVVEDTKKLQLDGDRTIFLIDTVQYWTAIPVRSG